MFSNQVFKIIYITATLSFLSINQSYSQQFNYSADFKRYCEYSKDSSSQFYYDSLLSSFKQNKDSLNNLDVIALKVGYICSETFNGVDPVFKEDEIIELITTGKLQQAASISHQILETHPINFVALMSLEYIGKALGKDNASKYEGMFTNILDALRWSGDGSMENPYFSILLTDGIRYISHILGGQILSSNTFTNEDGIVIKAHNFLIDDTKQTLHFNISHVNSYIENGTPSQ